MRNILLLFCKPTVYLKLISSISCQKLSYGSFIILISERTLLTVHLFWLLLDNQEPKARTAIPDSQLVVILRCKIRLMWIKSKLSFKILLYFQSYWIKTFKQTIKMVRVITQETYDEVVKENIEEFDMSPEEAIKEAVAQFEAQVSFFLPYFFLYLSGKYSTNAILLCFFQ